MHMLKLESVQALMELFSVMKVEKSYDTLLTLLLKKRRLQEKFNKLSSKTSVVSTYSDAKVSHMYVM